MVVAQEGKNTGFVLSQGDSRATDGGKNGIATTLQAQKGSLFCSELQPVRAHSSKPSAASGRREFPLYSVKTDEFIVPPGLLGGRGLQCGLLSHCRINPAQNVVLL